MCILGTLLPKYFSAQMYKLIQKDFLDRGQIRIICKHPLTEYSSFPLGVILKRATPPVPCMSWLRSLLEPDLPFLDFLSIAGERIACITKAEQMIQYRVICDTAKGFGLFLYILPHTTPCPLLTLENRSFFECFVTPIYTMH